MPDETGINENLVGSDEPDSATLVADAPSRRERATLFGPRQRYEALQIALHRAFISILWVVLIGFLVVFAIRIAHLILPENNAANSGSSYPHGWLTTDQLATIDRYFFSGAAGSAITWYLGGLRKGNRN
jgi:hypothetical protein